MKDTDYEVYIKIEEIRLLTALSKEIIEKMVDVGCKLGTLKDGNKELKNPADNLKRIFECDEETAQQLAELLHDLIVLSEVFHRNKDYETVQEVCSEMSKILDELGK